MPPEFKGFIPPEDIAYVDALVRAGESRSRKLALQRLCQFYRQGLVLPNPAPMRTVLVGLLDDESEKVRRWALNALAMVGTSRNAPAIIGAVMRYRAQPDLLGAGVAALASLLPKEQVGELLRKNELPLEGGLLLAASQRSFAFAEDLRKMRLDIEKADAVDLRLATILVGVGRAPEHLFSSRHPNSAIIGELNAHPDELVAQYSVWATVEHPDLSLADLRLPIADVEAQPQNVRGWVYRLVASSPVTALKHQDLLRAAASDDSAEAREGLAAGLVPVTFEGVDGIVVPWFIGEESEPVIQRLLEHMATHGHDQPRYSELVLDRYRAARSKSLVRSQLEAAAKGTSLYIKMKTIENDAERHDLFAAARQMGLDQTESVAGPRETFPDPNDVRVLIVTALELELAAVLGTLDRTRKLGGRDDPNIYNLGVYQVSQEDERAVIVCQSAMGKSNASTTATHALRTFPNVEHLIMCGIAGGCPNPGEPEEHVRLGDIVVSNDKGIIEYDFVKETEDGREIRSAAQKPARKVLGAARELIAGELLDQRPWEATLESLIGRHNHFQRPAADDDVLHVDDTAIDHPDDARRREGHPRVHAGAIATADTRQKNPDSRDMLRDRFGARAIEMEASGMQNAAWAAGKDIFVVRGICDYCDKYKSNRWQPYAAAAAAAFTRTIVEAMPAEWFPKAGREEPPTQPR